MATGLTQSDGSNITGFSAAVMPDKGFSKKDEPRVLSTAFGDGYEQRLSTGINPIEESYDVSFNNRARAEADDIIAFFENKKGVTNFSFTIPDTNSGGNERIIKVVCDNWSLSYINTEASSVSATFRRVYEP